MGAITNRMKAKWNWAKQNPLFWTNLLFVTISVLVIIYSGPSDFRIKAWAMCLQVVGVLTVWHDLSSAGKMFGLPKILTRNWGWLKAGFCGGNTVIRAATGECTATGGFGRGTVRRPFSPESPIEQRLDTLEYNFKKIDEDLSLAYREIEQKAAELKGALREETENRKSSHGELESKLKDAVVGNFGVLAFGAGWLGLGIFISTFAPEIAKIRVGQWAAVLSNI